MAEKPDLITIGESLIELSSEESLTTTDCLHKYYGGDTLATAITATRLGAKVGYITKIGDDAFKDYLLNRWQNEGLDTSQVKTINGYNGIYFISRPIDSEKEFAHYRKKTAATYLNTEDINEDYIKSGKMFYATGISQALSLNAKEAVQKAFLIAKENNLTCAYDPNFSDKVWSTHEAKEAFEEISQYVDIIFLNAVRDGKNLFEIESPESLIKHCFDLGIQTVCVRSSKVYGCYTGVEGNISFQEFKREPIVDATSSGDAFNGAFLYAVLQGHSPFEAARVAMATASLQVQGIGAIKSIPTKEQVTERLKSY